MSMRLLRTRAIVPSICLLVLLFAMTACAGNVSPTATAPATLIPLPASSRTPRPVSPTAQPGDLAVVWGEWWYEGEYIAAPDKYPSDPAVHDRSVNIRVSIRNNSTETLPGDVIPVFWLTDGEQERVVTTWYYSRDDVRPLEPGEEKEAVFRALTYAPGQWVSRVQIVWRGQVWGKDLPRQ